MCKKILVIDDNKLNIKLLEEILEDEDYIVESVSDARAAFEAAQSLKPDVILLDIMMPNLDGFEVCKLIKSDFDLHNTPIIMITAKTDGADVKRALELGAIDYIKKPIDEVEVLARIQSALRHKENEDKLRDLSMKDSLTGIYNHALLIDLLEKEVMKNNRSSKGISFIMLDIDFFKRVNDTYGHTTGDAVLRQLADILSDSVRKCDIVGRYGGEEFGIIFPEVEGIEGAKTACERIRQMVEENIFKAENREIRITISLGAYYKEPENAISAAEMIKKADDALYDAKKNGRNRVEIFTE